MGSAGPTPVIPFLVVGALGVFIYSSDVVDAVSFLSEVQDSALVLVIVIAVLLVSVIQLASEMIIIPLVFVLAVFMLKFVLVAPLVLLVVIHLIGKYYRPSEDAVAARWGGEGKGKYSSGGEEISGEEGIGFGAFMLVLLFLITYPMFYEGEGYAWVSLVMVFAFLLFFNMS